MEFSNKTLKALRDLAEHERNNGESLDDALLRVVTNVSLENEKKKVFSMRMRPSVHERLKLITETQKTTVDETVSELVERKLRELGLAEEGRK